jgi:ABC-2 type transport system permease protein
VTAPAMGGRSGGGAEILDRGYRHYDGPRGGLRSAMTSVARLTLLQSLGIRRSIGHKLLPTFAIFISYVPAIVFVGIVSLLDTEEMRRQGDFVLPRYGEYYGFIVTAILVFTSLVGPDALCQDRRNGMLGLYLASPLNRDTYLASRALGLLVVLGTVTIGPPLLLLLGYTIEGFGPDGVSGFLEIFGKILLAGFAISSLYVALALAAASFTTRRAVASATVILVLLITSAVVSTLITEGDAAAELFALDLASLPVELSFRTFGDVETIETARGASTGLLWGALLGWVALFVLVLRTRYRKLAVTR